MESTNPSSVDDIKDQISQLTTVLELVTTDEEKSSIETVISQLQQILNQELQTPDVESKALEDTSNSNSNSEPEQIDSRLQDGYLRDETDNATLSSSSSSSHDPSLAQPPAADNFLDEDLTASLLGSYVRCPFLDNGNHSTGLHNALVFSIADEFHVTVLYLQPLTLKMKPCTYFLQGNCKFESQFCKFSHGHKVGILELEEYKEANYSSLSVDSIVLAKCEDELWYRARIKDITASKNCEIVYESYPKSVTVPLHDVVPLDNIDNNDRVSDSDEDDDNSNWKVEEVSDQTEKVFINWSTIDSSSGRLGEWEQYTKGIGSKLLRQMGYVFGTGLGKNLDGRVEPVPAIICPPGSSLDHIMTLREKSGGANNLDFLSVEKHLQRLKKKMEKSNGNILKRKDKSDSVFGLINQLSLSKCPSTLTNETVNVTKSSCNTLLSKQLFSVGEKVNMVKKNISKCEEGIKRHELRDSKTTRVMKDKLVELKEELAHLERQEKKVVKEMERRGDRKKLTTF